MARIALCHHGSWLEGGVGDLSDGKLLVVSLLSRDNWSVRRKHEVDTRVWHKIGLELGDIDVEGTIETKGSGQRRDNLSDQPVKVGVCWALDVEVAAADIVDSLVVEHDSNVSVLKKRVGREHGVVWLNHSSGYLRGWVYGESELGLAAVVDGKALKEKRSKSGTGTSTNSVKAEETLKTGTLVSKLAHAIKYEVNNFLSDGVVSTGVVVGCIFLAGDDLLRVVQLAVGTSAHFITDGWLQVYENATRNMLSSTSLREKGVEGIITTADGLIRWHLTIWLDTVLKAIQLPAGVTYLKTSLANVNGDYFSHDCVGG
jgi:hypothetical protein